MAPFTVLHVCMGNICRSPMAERLLARAVQDRAAALAAAGPAATLAESLVHSVSAGTGAWHEGEEMNPSAARQVKARGGTTDGFTARKLRGEHIDGADLVLTATADQLDYVLALRPEAAGRTFVLGEFGRLLDAIDAATLPAGAPTPDAVQARGAALVVAAVRARADDQAQPGDDLDDPWGRGDQTFTRVGDAIEETTRPLAKILLS